MQLSQLQKNALITKLLSKFLVLNVGEYVDSWRLMSIVFNHCEF